MIYIIFILCTLETNADTMTITTPPVKSYTKQVIFNGILGVGFGVGSGIFYTKGNTAYNNYETSRTIQDAVEYWNETQLYDNLRNICVVGALVFLTRSLYFQTKQWKVNRSYGLKPVIDLQWSDNLTLSIGLTKQL